MKKELRKWAKSVRSSLNMEEISKELAQKLSMTDEYKNAKNIMLFYPKKDEVNLLSLLNDKSKKFYLPKIEGDNLLCCPFSETEELCTSCFNTKEPLTEPCDKNLIDLVIVPALACDKNNYRLGYGGGFYDKFLNNTSSIKIACIPKELMVETIYPECFDIKMDKIIKSDQPN